MKMVIFCLMILLSTIGCRSLHQLNVQEHKSTINLESAWKYFELVNKVKLGNSISEDQWNEFINLKGNRLFIDENNISTKTLELIRSEIELVYHPKNDSKLKSSLSSDIRLQIRNRYFENEQLYITHLDKIEKDKITYVNNALELTREYLPKRMHKLYTFPNIYIHALWDGSASSEGIFVDIILAYDFDQKRAGSFISHELHHFMRESIIEDDKIEKQDKGLIWAIESTFNEGFADLVDKSALVFEGSDWWLNEQYMAFLNYAENVIKELDEKIKEESKGTSYDESKYREVLFNSVGHIPGQYMGEKIKENGRLNEIIRHADNPFLFFIVYNEIAEKNPKIVSFSQESIEYIKQLNKKYN